MSHTKSRMREMEAREDVLKELLSREPIDIPDIHPNVSEIYRRKVERLSEALSSPQDRAEASAAIRALVEKIELKPGPNRGEIDATLHGDLSTILGWIEAQGLENPRKQNTPDAFASGVSVSVGAGTRNHLKLCLVSDHLASFAGPAPAQKIGLFRAVA